MATVSFDKNIVIKEPESVEKLVDILTEDKVKPINKELASDWSMAKGEKLLKRYLFHSKNY